LRKMERRNANQKKNRFGLTLSHYSSATALNSNPDADASPPGAMKLGPLNTRAKLL
jgi:hypothetical protein